MDFDALRKNMVEVQLVGRGDITDKKVIEAFLKVPRHRFVSEKLQKDAYGDYPLPIGSGQTISQPYMVALMTQCLQLNGSEKVLEIGTGSGYQTAILAELANQVYTIERYPDLSKSVENITKELGYKNIYFKVGDGTLGWHEKSPFDAIIVTAGAPDAPKYLLEQLADGGRLVIPVGSEFTQRLMVYEKIKDEIKTNQVCACTFVKLIGKAAWKE